MLAFGEGFRLARTKRENDDHQDVVFWKGLRLKKKNKKYYFQELVGITKNGFDRFMEANNFGRVDSLTIRINLGWWSRWMDRSMGQAVFWQSQFKCRVFPVGFPGALIKGRKIIRISN